MFLSISYEGHFITTHVFSKHLDKSLDNRSMNTHQFLQI